MREHVNSLLPKAEPATPKQGAGSLHGQQVASVCGYVIRSAVFPQTVLVYQLSQKPALLHHCCPLLAVPRSNNRILGDKPANNRT